MPGSKLLRTIENDIGNDQMNTNFIEIYYLEKKNESIKFEILSN